MPNQPMALWTVYNHPHDYPDFFVARRSEISAGGVKTTGEVVIASELERVRNELSSRGLVRLPKLPDEEAIIIEVWL